MAKVVMVVRILLGLMFFASGMIGILNLVKAELLPGDAGVYVNILTVHGFMKFVSLLMVIAGLLLMVGRYVPLGLVILGPILVNILLYHLLLDPKGIAPGIVVTAMEVFLIWAYRLSFRGLFDASPEIA